MLFSWFCSPTVNISPLLLFCFHFPPLKITHSLVCMQRYPPTFSFSLREIFYLYTIFPANATNEKRRSGPQEMLGPSNWHCWCLSISLSFKKACWFSIPQYWPTVSVWCMHAPPPTPNPPATNTQTFINTPPPNSASMQTQCLGLTC